ncbi:MAG: Hint domain-containing protein [Pseudoruegeria sp.]
MADPYISEIRYFGTSSTDFIEIATDSDFDESTITVIVYNASGNVRTTHSLPSTPDATIAGNNVFVLDGFGINQSGAVALQINGVTTSLISFDRDFTIDGVDSNQVGTTTSGESLVSSDGVNYTVQSPPSPGVIPCFLAGTLINTPEGLRKTETLLPGDLVQTTNGNQQLRWIGKRTISGHHAASYNLQPVCIPAGALGPNRPNRDLFVSPSHRIFLSDGRFPLLFDSETILVPAQHLIGWRGIKQITHLQDITYVHLLFDAHELVYSEGLLTESFHPAARNTDDFSREARRELRMLFPEIWRDPDVFGDTYATCLKSYETTVALDIMDATIAA